jgi:hypothetical protein
MVNKDLASLVITSDNQDMDKSVRKYASLKEMKADEYRYWQSRPAHERMSAVSELTLAVYAMKEPAAHVRRLQRTLVCLQRPQR